MEIDDIYARSDRLPSTVSHGAYPCSVVHHLHQSPAQHVSGDRTVRGQDDIGERCLGGPDRALQNLHGVVVHMRGRVGGVVSA